MRKVFKIIRIVTDWLLIPQFACDLIMRMLIVLCVFTVMSKVLELTIPMWMQIIGMYWLFVPMIYKMKRIAESVIYN